MDVTSLFFWALMVIGLRSRGPLMLHIFFAVLPFDTTAVVPPALLGGATFTPGWVAMACLVLKLVLLQPSLSEALSPLWDPRKLGLLSACSIYGVMSAYFFPRLFEGQFDVFPMRYEGQSIPLAPSPTNVTQAFYLIMTTLGVLSFYLAARTPEMRRHALNALLVGGVVAILTGIADIFTYTFGLSAILEPLRTANYAFLTEAEVLGAKRVAGLCSEASVYAALCMGFAAPIFFLRNTFKRHFTRNVLAPLIFGALVIMVALSTSSTGYVGLGVLTVVVLIFGVRQSLKGRSIGRYNLAVVYAIAAALFTAVVFRADILEKAADIVNEMVLNKTMSGSYIERSSWNSSTYQAFLSTYGLGAGLGSTRASSWIIAVLGNIGAVGAILMLAFLARAFLSPVLQRHAQDEEIATGAKAAIIPMLAMSLLVGSSVGFGLMQACMFGFIGAATWGSAKGRQAFKRRRRRPTPALRARPRARSQIEIPIL